MGCSNSARMGELAEGDEEDPCAPVVSSKWQWCSERGKESYLWRHEAEEQELWVGEKMRSVWDIFAHVASSPKIPASHSSAGKTPAFLQHPSTHKAFHTAPHCQTEALPTSYPTSVTASATLDHT